MLLDQIRNDSDLAYALSYAADFDVSRTYEFVEAVHLSSGAALERVAGDAAGGAFFLVGEGGEDRPVLYADSEGSAGLVGWNLRSVVEAVVLLPYWHDLLGSGAASLAELRQTAASLVGEYAEITEDDPDQQVQQRIAIEKLGLPWSEDPLAALSAAMAATSPDFVLFNSEEGNPYELLS
ncbi:hypothetical protein AB0M47_01515 [Hamadaea sp. NPDC051192]|uniref:hypothetical protein n=1 Tax=Hamadaea sp. NPDC051192 TaxID=3154940 RepID=UPI003433FC19